VTEVSAQANKVLTDVPKDWMQHPVCVVLNDGSFYVGWITDWNENELTLSGRKGRGKINKASLHQMNGPKISAFGPGAQAFNGFGGGFPPFGFSPAGAGLAAGGNTGGWGGVGGFMGMMKQVWPGIQLGLGIVRTVMPLMGGFKL
jgi:hypothetical protein